MLNRYCAAATFVAGINGLVGVQQLSYLCLRKIVIFTKITQTLKEHLLTSFL